MKKVLWISRHEMTQEQCSDLDRITGGWEQLLHMDVRSQRL